MKITADTNVLVRAVMGDHPAQSPAAKRALAQATAVIVPIAALCEFAWVLRRAYGLSAADTSTAIRTLLNAQNVIADLSEANAGLQCLDNGADFADGAIAHAGAVLGADSLASFDRKAIRVLAALGVKSFKPV